MTDSIAFTIFRSLVLVVVFPILTWSRLPIAALDMNLFVLIVASAVCEVLAILSQIYGLSVGDVSSMSAILSSSILFYIPLSFLFLGEFYGLHVLLYMLVVLVGSVLVSVDEKLKPRELLSIHNKQLIAGILALLFYSLASITSKPVLQTVNPENLTVYRQIVGTLFLLVMSPLILKGHQRRVLKEGIRQTLPYMIIYVFVSYISYFFMFSGFAISVSITETMVAMQGVFTILLVFILRRIWPSMVHEAHPQWVYNLRIIGSILIILGIALLYFT